MICMDNGMELNFLTVGLFSTDAPWSHPVIAVAENAVVVLTLSSDTSRKLTTRIIT